MDEQLQRVQREKEAWNEGFDRSSFDAVWRHAGAYWDEEVDILLKNVFAPYRGGRFLEIGSSTWQNWILRLETEIGSLECINISETEIELGKRAVSEAPFKPVFTVMDAHKLEFEPGSFDVVFGKAILHHLDYEVALAQIQHVLRPGGLMIFMEPLDFNPVMKLVRALTPSYRTPDEEPINSKHMSLFGRYFDVEIKPVEFVSAAVSPISRAVFKEPKNILTRLAWEIDRVARHVPGLKLWFRSGLIIGRKPDVLLSSD